MEFKWCEKLSQFDNNTLNVKTTSLANVFVTVLQHQKDFNLSRNEPRD